MNLGKTVVVVLIVILLTSGITQIVYSRYKYLSTKNIPVYVEVVSGSHIGLNTRTDGLYFGKIPMGDSGRRFLTINNEHRSDSEVLIATSEEVADWMIPSDNKFILHPGESKDMTVDIFIPTNASVGNYTGKMTVYLTRA